MKSVHRYANKFNLPVGLCWAVINQCGGVEVWKELTKTSAEPKHLRGFVFTDDTTRFFLANRKDICKVVKSIDQARSIVKEKDLDLSIATCLGGGTLSSNDDKLVAHRLTVWVAMKVWRALK